MDIEDAFWQKIQTQAFDSRVLEEMLIAEGF